MSRLARFLLLAALWPASSTHAQSAQALLDDAESVRRALGESVHANVLIETGTLAAPARMHIGESTITVEFADGTARAIAPDDTTAAIEWRLIAAATLRSRLDDLLVSFGVLDTSETTIVVDDAPDSVTGFAVRVGTDILGATLELGTGRLRQLTVVADGVRWRLDAGGDDRFANGWFFGEIEVFRDGVRAVRVSVTDLAPRRDSLAPLASAPAEPPSQAPQMPVSTRLPWLPL